LQRIGSPIYLDFLAKKNNALNGKTIITHRAAIATPKKIYKYSTLLDPLPPPPPKDENKKKGKKRL
jgi:hypothetical protein